MEMMSESSMAIGMLVGMFSGIFYGTGYSIAYGGVNQALKTLKIYIPKGSASKDEIERAIDIIEEGKAIWLCRVDDDGETWEYDYGFYEEHAERHGYFYIRDSRKEDDEPPESYVISIGFFEYNRLFGFMPGGDTHEAED